MSLIEVEMVECEQGVKERLAEVKQFNSLSEAKTFVRIYNTPTNNQSNSEFEIYARIKTTNHGKVS